MPEFSESNPEDFTSPTAVPEESSQADRWQQMNRTWWESHPMRYDWRSDLDYEPFSREFYEEIDRRFFGAARTYMPWRQLPFDALIDFDALPEMDVLEIGVGNGSHAGLIASHAKSYTGVDLTEYAVNSTTRRLDLMGIDATIRQMDAEKLEFPDESFDFVWSWGVVHHSANPPAILRQIQRVLRPGGRTVLMVYYRGYWNYWVTGAGYALTSGDLWTRRRTMHEIMQSRTDGAMARFYSPAEWRALLAELFEVEFIRIYGPKIGLVPIPSGQLRNALAGVIPDALGRLFTNQLRMGHFLVSGARKHG